MSSRPSVSSSSSGLTPLRRGAASGTRRGSDARVRSGRTQNGRARPDPPRGRSGPGRLTDDRRHAAAAGVVSRALPTASATTTSPHWQRERRWRTHPTGCPARGARRRRGGRVARGVRRPLCGWPAPLPAVASRAVAAPPEWGTRAVALSPPRSSTEDARAIVHSCAVVFGPVPYEPPDWADPPAVSPARHRRGLRHCTSTGTVRQGQTRQTAGPGLNHSLATRHSHLILVATPMQAHGGLI
jgi:hypothetical protein